MRLFFLVSLLLACSPVLDWRDVRFDQASLLALLPCRPDRASREVPLAGRPATLQMAGCDAGGATFAVMVARLDDAGAAQDALQGWRQATLDHIQGRMQQQAPFALAGSLPLAASVRLSATGRRADGRALQAQAVWLALPQGRGALLVHAVLYADAVAPEVADTFFAGLRQP